MEWPPYKLVRVPSVPAHFTGFTDVTAYTPPEKEGLGDSVGAVEGRDTNREDDIESGGGAEVDNANETGNAS